MLEVQSQESGRGKCPFDTNQPFTSTVAGQQLFTGLFADFFGEDSAILRSSCGEHQQTMRTEHADQHLLHEPRFVYSRLIPETDDPDDDKVYFFFSETTTGSDGRSKARRARVARVCVNDAGGERVLVNKWTTFTKTRLVCSVPGPDGIDTHFDELVDVFVLSERDEKNPIIYGLFSTVSHVFHGFAVCVYRMVDVRDAFSGPYAQQYAGYRHMGASRQEKVPYPRPGFCPSRITSWPGAQLRGTRSYPDAVLHFARVHPLMARAVLPSHGAPVWHSAGPPECRFTSFTVDLVEAADGVYDVIFLGTDCGKVLKVVSINQIESGEPEAIILEEMQIFKTPMPITTMKISVKRGQLFVGSTLGVARVAVSECARYGNECAECCLARDPYCAWDGMACSTYQSFSRRRFRRQNVRNGDPFIQCLDQNHQGDLASRLPEHLVFGVERNSTLLECQPRSLQASVTWHVQHFHNGRRGQVKTDERVMATELGLLFRSLHRLDSGLYSCHAAEHGFSQTVGRYRLEVIANARLEGLMERAGDKKERPFAAVASSRQPCTASPVGRAPVSQPWFKGVMHLLGTSQHLQDFCQNIGCKAAWLRKGRSGRKGSSGKWALGQESKKRRRRHRTRTPRAAKPKQARRLN
uniref:Sema domain, immunoglobulin domain (Ig), short basic domain, secreted, (semaphorin) 3bl n=1 Tax=Eptatretus burgeri TaxID=7764 RepID=A0A8C4ND36_EPTBU